MSEGVERASLSEAGMERREEILAIARGAQRRRVKRRLAVRVGGALVVLCAVGIGAKVGLSPAPVTPPVNPGWSSEGPVAARVGPEAPSTRIAIVHTSASALERARASGEARVEIIGDEELLHLLRRQGHSVGLIRTQGRTVLVGLPSSEVEGEEAVSG